MTNISIDKTLVIKDSEETYAPETIIDGCRYILLCEYQGKDGKEQSFYINEESSNVIVEIDREKAIVGLFSSEQNKLKQLFNYLESTISSDGFICYEKNIFPHLLQLVIETGGKYPSIQNKINYQKITFIDKVISLLLPNRFLDQKTLEHIQQHTIPCTHIERRPSRSFFMSI